LRKSAEAPPSSILLLGLLASLPGFGVDMALPALASTAASIGIPTQSAGLTISSYMISFGIAPLVYGPVSDRRGRKPVVMFGCAIFVVAGLGCVLAQSLPMLLACRVIQGVGAAAMTLAMVIARDSFDDTVLREKLSYIIVAIYLSPIAAPSAGAAVLALVGWRAIYASLVALGLLVSVGVWFGLDENAPSSPGRVRFLDIVSDYRRVLSHPVCRSYVAAGASSFGVVAAYTTGSSLFFIKAAGMSPTQFSMIFGVTALASVAGALLDSQLAARGMSSLRSLSIGLIVVTAASAALFLMAVIGWTPIPIAVSLFMATTFGVGTIAPGVTQGALQQMPQMAGTVSAVSNCVAMMAGSLSSALAAEFFDGRTMLSVSSTMLLCALSALIFFRMATRSTIKRPLSQTEI
jgi:DHA1 family bicyclomycin/chloramphenicol resistance-like MFS transporter